MVIKVLAENTAISQQYKTEHGLSLYIETGNHKILFDTGGSGIFLKNAKKLGVNIEDVDLVVISHGHLDHGGGLKSFLRENIKASVYLHPKAFGKHYSERPKGLAFIGLDEALINNDRVLFTSDHFSIDNGIELFSNISGKELLPLSNKALKMEKEDRIVEDTFEHEQNLIITEAGRNMLFSGCAHNGIINIIGRFIELKKSPPDYVFGGFHLYNPSTKTSEAPALITLIGETLKKTDSKYYTCHCTGIDAYGQLKSIMGEQLEYLATGSVVEI